MPASLTTRLLLAVGVLALTAIVLIAVAARQGTRAEFLRFTEVQRRELSSQLPALAGRLGRELDGRCCTGDALRAVTPQLPRDAALLVVDASTHALIASAGAALEHAGRPATRRDGDTLSIELTRGAGSRVERVSLQFLQKGTPLRLAGGGDALVYVVPLPPAEAGGLEAAFLGALDRRLVITAIVVGAFAMAATWALVRGVTGPLNELQAASRDLAGGKLARRVVPRGSREVAALANAFNAMAGELQRQEWLRRDLVRDVAHELRTPLTDLRCRLEAVIDGLADNPQQSLRDLRDDVAHLSRLVDDLQDLAQAEARVLALDLQAVTLPDAVRAALRTAQLDADSRVVTNGANTMAVRADPDRLRQILVNLLTNAGRHTPAGGTITIAADSDGDRVRLEVRNSGSSLSDSQLARVFDRFYRADPARGRTTGGSGLGLAIVKQLVEAHGGEVWARSDAGSVTVGFSLPRA